jgi:hypothetical protein
MIQLRPFSRGPLLLDNVVTIRCSLLDLLLLVSGVVGPHELALILEILRL